MVGLTVIGVVRPAGRIRIGADGIEVDRGFQRSFIPIDTVTGVADWRPRRSKEPTASRGPLRGIAIRRADGPPIYLPLKQDPGHLEDVKARILDAARLARERRTGGLGALARAGRSLSVWQQDLEGLLSRDPGFRVAALSLDQAIQVLEDPTADVEQRLGAALAIRSTGDAPATERIRIAASASAMPGVRLALDKIADDADATAEIEAALQNDEAEERTRG